MWALSHLLFTSRVLTARLIQWTPSSPLLAFIVRNASDSRHDEYRKRSETSSPPITPTRRYRSRSRHRSRRLIFTAAHSRIFRSVPPHSASLRTIQHNDIALSCRHLTHLLEPGTRIGSIVTLTFTDEPIHIRDA